MMDRNYGCRFSSFIENGKIMNDYRVVFTKKKAE
jgi:hypothetical protein